MRVASRGLILLIGVSPSRVVRISRRTVCQTRRSVRASRRLSRMGFGLGRRVIVAVGSIGHAATVFCSAGDRDTDFVFSE